MEEEGARLRRKDVGTTVKSYPSIPRCPKSGSGIRLHTFDKIDGSNLRFEWSRKRGWHKFGTRTRLFDETDDIFGCAIPLFNDSLADPLEKIIRDSRWESAVVFCEFWGKNSFAGVHNKDDEAHLTVIDVNPYKKGILPPTEFLDLFGVYGPFYLGYINWGPEFLDSVYSSTLEVISFEGVVGKANGKGNTILMMKYKTKAWMDKVKELYGADAEAIINS